MDVKFLSEIGTPFTMIKVMTRIPVVLCKGRQSVLPLLKSIGRLDYPNFISQDDECVTAMMMIPPGGIMGQVRIADQSDKAHATKVTDHDACKYYLRNHYRGYNHVLNIAQSLQSMDHLQAN